MREKFKTLSEDENTKKMKTDTKKIRKKKIQLNNKQQEGVRQKSERIKGFGIIKIKRNHGSHRIEQNNFSKRTFHKNSGKRKSKVRFHFYPFPSTLLFFFRKPFSRKFLHIFF